MRRLARRLFTLCSAASLLLCVAVCVLWAWPHAAGRAVRLNKGEYETGEYQTWIARDRGGRFVLEVSPYPVAYPLPSDSAPTFGSALVVVLPSEHRPFPGLRWVDNVMPVTGQITSRHVTVACWLPALAFAVLPMVLLVRHRQAHRPRAGECAACGYDLRATPGRCPECGTEAGRVTLSREQVL